MVFSAFSKFGKIGLVAFLLATVIYLTAFSVPYWLVLYDVETDKGKVTLYVGLWEICYDGEELDICLRQSEVSHLSRQSTGLDFPASYRGVQALACFAVMALLADWALRCLFLCKRLQRFFVISIILDFVAGGFAWLAALVCGNEVRSSGYLKGASLSGSFVLSIISGVMFVAAGILLVVDLASNRQTRAPVNSV